MKHKAVIFLISGEFALATMAAAIKYLSDFVPIEMMVFFRNFFGLLCLLPLLLLNNRWQQLKTSRLGLHIFRATTGMTAMFGYFYILSELPLAEATLVKLTSPLFLPIICLLWLKAPIHQWTMVMLAIGFIGVIFIIEPGTSNFKIATLIGLGAAILACFAKVSIRKMADTEPGFRIVFYFGVFSSLFSSIPMILHWQTVSTHDWLWLIGIGLLGTLGQLFMTQAYRLAIPGEIGIYTYTAIIFSTILGWFIWSETLSLSTWIGCLFIVGAGIGQFKTHKTQVKTSYSVAN